MTGGAGFIGSHLVARATVIDGAIYGISQSRVKKELDEVSFTKFSFNELSDKVKNSCFARTANSS